MCHFLCHDFSQFHVTSKIHYSGDLLNQKVKFCNINVMNQLNFKCKDIEQAQLFEFETGFEQNKRFLAF